jgi:hypothetical protein
MSYPDSPLARTKGRPFLNLFTGTIVTLLILFGCVGLVIVGPQILSRLAPMFGLMYKGELPLDTSAAKTSGPSRSFQEMWDVAQKEVTRVDKDAVLNYVAAAPVGYHAGLPYSGPVTGTLLVSFDYFLPDGNNISVDVEDADPASTVTSSPRGDRPSPGGQVMYKDRQNDLPNKERMLKSLNLTPRDAVARTWADAQEYGVNNGLMPEHILPLVSVSRALSGTVQWSVDYWYKPPRNSISLSGVFDVSGGVVSYSVDDQTGEIVRTEYKTIEPTPAPNP